VAVTQGGGGDLGLRRCGSAFAGQPFASEVPPGGCVRILTGAPMPEQLDRVVIQERVLADELGVEIIDLGLVRDDPRALEDALRQGAQQPPFSSSCAPPRGC